jgi:hypothetical protein
MRRIIYCWVFLMSLLVITACGGSDELIPIVEVDSVGSTTINSNSLNFNLYGIAAGVLTAEEENSLLFMREEEKLARDVYLSLYESHGMSIFSNIAASEQTHTDAVGLLITRYDLLDPMQTDIAGTFVNNDLQIIYDALVAAGANSLLDALYVGAQIEELDIYDLHQQIAIIIDNPDMILVYENLLKGSRNHLRSFDKQIKAANGLYIPIYISQQEYDNIVNSDMERN